MSEQMVRVLGFDWVLALLAPKVHSATVFLALRILLALLAHPHLLSKFREGSGNGGWLSDADSVVRNRAAVRSLRHYGIRYSSGCSGVLCLCSWRLCRLEN